MIQRKKGNGAINYFLDFIEKQGNNLLIGSTVTKWSIMAPIFVPMYMMLNLPPEYTLACLSHWRLCNPYHITVNAFLRNRINISGAV